MIEKGLAGLDFMVAVDMYINETTQYADIILPPAVGLETMHYSFVLHMVATRNTTKFSPAPLSISKEQRYDWQIMSELQRRLYSGGLIGRVKNNINSRIHPKTKLDLALKTGAYGIWGGRFMKSDGISLKRLMKEKAGIELAPLSSVLPERLYTKNKRIKLMPKLFAEELQKVKALLAPKVDSQFPLRLIGRRHLRSNNSWMHNLPVLEGGSKKCTVMIHPDDAIKYQISDGEEIEVFTEIGKVLIEAEITTDIIVGTISIPHGWGHSGKGLQLKRAERFAGVNVNEINNHQRLDPLSFNAAFNGQPVGIQNTKQSNAV
ncbi:MAG: molybdopterin dinucleotide binding domain-containing protein [Bacteroidota bacterium]